MGARLCIYSADVEKHAATKIFDTDRAVLSQVVYPLFATLPEPHFKTPSFLEENLMQPALRFTTGGSSSSRVPLQVAMKGKSSQGCTQSALTSLAERMVQALRSAKRNGALRQVELSMPDEQPAELCLAALSLALLRTSQEGMTGPTDMILCLSRRRSRGPVLTAWRQWQERSRLDRVNVKWEPLPERKGSHRWIREDNGPECRLQRLGAAFSTLRQVFHHRSVPALVQGTRLLRPVRLRPSPHCQWTSLRHTGDTVLDAAVGRARLGVKVAAVNAASAYQVGGGFLSGGRHALEEAMCMQSTLFVSLQQAARLAAAKRLTDQRGRRLHIPEDGAVLSPGVQVFRKGTSCGYAPCLEATCLAAVVSVAMPNVNPCNSSSPMEWRSPEEQVLLVERKLHAVLQGAALVEAEVLVVPDLGCGVFGNNPSVIGAALGRVLCAYRGYFSEILMTGREEFYLAASGSVGPSFLTCIGEPCEGGAAVCSDSCSQTALEVVRTVSGRPTRSVGSPAAREGPSLKSSVKADTRVVHTSVPAVAPPREARSASVAESDFGVIPAVIELISSVCCCSMGGFRMLATDLAYRRRRAQ
eukprot:TRINITY_DN109815_c0_g1_i1.p1 TRINITY_DN109815_c0_g1~~TRINITY_DN109815_c0_g1_i1.p1  ORF type:complete len:586 (+),score=83.22 TRINITY_DN109815_c0_g1_i1:56-1813(+)